MIESFSALRQHYVAAVANQPPLYDKRIGHNNHGSRVPWSVYAPGRIRTSNLDDRSVLLCPLSYEGIQVPLGGVGPPSRPFQGCALPLSYKGNRKSHPKQPQGVRLSTGGYLKFLRCIVLTMYQISSAISMASSSSSPSSISS